jgi:hypothetical protein
VGGSRFPSSIAEKDGPTASQPSRPWLVVGNLWTMTACPLTLPTCPRRWTARSRSCCDRQPGSRLELLS